MDKCCQCGNVLNTGDDISGICSSCKEKNKFSFGWICPICGRGNSPFTSTCSCKPMNYTITCNNKG